MFEQKDLECLDPGYFEIICMNDRDVTIMSRNILCPDPALFFISIRFHIRIISMAAVIRCGRLCGVLKVMTDGRWGKGETLV